MLCPKCLTNTRVTSTTKLSYEGVQRYRYCPNCHFGFITKETLQAITATTAFSNADKKMTVKYGQETNEDGQAT